MKAATKQQRPADRQVGQGAQSSAVGTGDSVTNSSTPASPRNVPLDDAELARRVLRLPVHHDHPEVAASMRRMRIRALTYLVKHRLEQRRVMQQQRAAQRPVQRPREHRAQPIVRAAVAVLDRDGGDGADAGDVDSDGALVGGVR